MPMANLDPAFELGKRLSGMQQDIRALATKAPVFQIESDLANSDNFGVPSAGSWSPSLPLLAAATVTIPTGFTTAFLTATTDISISCQPPSGVTNDWLAARVFVESTSPGTNQLWSGAAEVFGTSDGNGNNAWPLPFATEYPFFSTIWPGLVGGYTITAGLQARTGQGWAANTANVATCQLNVFFFP